MRVLIVALAAIVVSAGTASADPCDVLIETVQSALAAPDITAEQRSEFESILKNGHAAKAAGDTKACSAAMTSTTDKAKLPLTIPGMESPNNRSGHNCQKSLNTV